MAKEFLSGKINNKNWSRGPLQKPSLNGHLLSEGNVGGLSQDWKSIPTLRKVAIVIVTIGGLLGLHSMVTNRRG